mgnify:CR=1 FL=1|jgi:hypothetical protein
MGLIMGGMGQQQIEDVEAAVADAAAICMLTV